MLPHIHDVIIIGAGPAGLAAAARLRERTPSATFTDDEHQRYHWIKKHGQKVNVKNYKTSKDSLPTSPSTQSNSDCCCDCEHATSKRETDMLVVDADGAGWMSRWNRLFQTFGIDYLRSPMFFHVDPADRDGLLAYTHEKAREQEVFSLPGCVGKEFSKHRRKKRMKKQGSFLNKTPTVDERDRKDYFAPSTKLFCAHCEEVAQRYGLANSMVRQELVVDIEYCQPLVYGDGDENVDQESQTKVFRVTTDKDVRFSRVVVLAVGPGNSPSFPSPIPGLPSLADHEGFTHAMHLTHFPPPHIEAKIKARGTTTMAVVGGGLTSVQIADLALKRGISKVHLIMRGPVKVKYFDMDLDWVAKFRNYKQAEFWTADDDEERYQMYTQARNGGSMNPRYRKILDDHVSRGKITLHTHTTLKSVQWNPVSRSWVGLNTSPPSALANIDYIVFATGVQTNVETIPFLQTMLKDYPIRCVGGFPCLNDDLMWSDDVPLFATGRLAGLRLGPGAPNLVGCRVGAERVAWNIEEVLRKACRSRGVGPISEESDSAEDSLKVFASGRGNKFFSLSGIENLT